MSALLPHPIAWRAAGRHSVYTWVNLWLVLCLLVFAVGTWVRWRTVRETQAMIDKFPASVKHQMAVDYWLIPDGITPSAQGLAEETAAFQFQVAGALGLLAIHLILSFRAVVLWERRWDTPWRPEVRVLPLSLERAHFALVDWALVPVSAAVCLCALMLVVLPAREPGLGLFDPLYAPWMTARGLLIHGNHHHALWLLAMLTACWAVYRCVLLARLVGPRILIGPVMAGVLLAMLTMATQLDVYDLSIAAYDKDVLGFGLRVHALLLQGLLFLILISFHARSVYFRELRKWIDENG